MENIFVENFAMTDILEEAILINLHYSASTNQPKSNKPPVFRHIRIKNITCKGAGQAVVLRGLPQQPLEDISMENISICSNEGMVCEHVKGLSMKGVDIDTSMAFGGVCGNGN